MDYTLSKLKEIENKFIKLGYSKKEIEIIENKNNGTSLQDKIENLIFESTNLK
ncbi:hypothetical protein [Clostridium sp. VAP52]|uniref:hypothetical protein n=1 Tax=Clostridium sp. VAP52 TaxID=2949977 RepID=UPI00207A4F20|nr:hypothetical protein [Clostridium sp. VAP52]